MNCQELWTAMTDKADAECARHLEECPACAARMERQRLLIASLRTVAAEWRSMEAPARVEAALVAAYRAQGGVRAPARRQWWLPVLSWAAAAAAMFALGVFLVRDRQPRAESAPAHRTAPAGLEWASLDWSAGADAHGDATGYDNDFIPLPNAQRVGPDEEVNLVRVEVPPSALLALGFVERADRAGPVQADVMLGSDGLARAVRFVDE